VKGIQIMNDMGNYMFSRYRGEWIPDTDGRRRVIMQNLRNWNVFSNSSPVEGITAAIRTFYDPDKKISIYVFGDEFTGQSIAEVVDTVDRINREAGDGERRVRIHAVGFPVQFIRAANQQTTGIRFATLMRELTYRNGGPLSVSMTSGPEHHLASRRCAVTLPAAHLPAAGPRRWSSRATFPKPLLEPLPVTLGVWYPEEFASHEFFDEAKGRAESDWIVRTGEAQVRCGTSSWRHVRAP
jgi:hypothetical protein